MYGPPLEPTDLFPLGPAEDAPGGLRGAIVRRYLETARSCSLRDLDRLAAACVDELDDLEG